MPAVPSRSITRSSAPAKKAPTKKAGTKTAVKAPARKAAAKKAPATKAPARAGDTYAKKPWLAAYPEGVPHTYRFPTSPLTRLLDDAAGAFPDHAALAFLGTTISYRELKDQVDRFAGALRGLGVVKGDRVALVLPNCPQNVVAFFAALRLGAVVVEHNPLYTEAELRHQLADCGAKVVICLDRVAANLAAVKKDTSVEHVVTTSLVDYLPLSSRLKLRLPVAKARAKRAELSSAVPSGSKDFGALLKGAKPVPLQEPVTSHDLALLQYTGGTTGLSKGAKLTHGNLVANTYMNRLWDPAAVAGREVTLAVLPLFHVYGLTVAMLNTILLGGKLVLLPKFDLDLVFEAIGEHKPTLFPGVPPIYKAIADSPRSKEVDLRTIRLCMSGAMKLPSEIHEQFTRISGAVLIEGYGMTETSPVTHSNPTSGGKIGTIGVPLPGTSVKVVDQDDASKVLPAGQPGELAVSGPQVFSGYWGREDTDGLFTKDGYLLTGDVAVMDDEGFFTIVDRKKELIIAGGFNIYPSEVEEVLFTLPGLADVCVVGVPDKYRGETVKAYVVRAPGAKLTEDDVVSHAAASLTAYKVPKLVEFRDSLPRTVVGKVLRRVLLEEEKAKAAGGTAKAVASKKAAAPKAPTEGKAATDPKVSGSEASGSKAAGSQASGGKVPARKAVVKAPTKLTAKPPAAKRAVAGKPGTPVSTAKKAPAKKAVAKKAAAPAKKAPAKNAVAPVKKAPAKKAPAKKAPAKG